MADLASGETYVDGQTVNAARLNNMINAAIAQPGLISSKANVTPVGADSLLLLQGGVLKKCLVSGLPSSAGTVTSVAMTVPAGFTVSGTPVTGAGTLGLGLTGQGQNKVLRAAADGTVGTPTFRVTDVRDLRVASLNIAANNINWDLGSHFYKVLSGPQTLSFTNEFDGGTIYVALHGNGSTRVVTWPTLVWDGGSAPVNSAGWDLYQITYCNQKFAIRIRTP